MSQETECKEGTKYNSSFFHEQVEREEDREALASWDGESINLLETDKPETFIQKSIKFRELGSIWGAFYELSFWRSLSHLISLKYPSIRPIPILIHTSSGCRFICDRAGDEPFFQTIEDIKYQYQFPVSLSPTRRHHCKYQAPTPLSGFFWVLPPIKHPA